jgi:hypothetical protein
VKAPGSSSNPKGISRMEIYLMDLQNIKDKLFKVSGSNTLSIACPLYILEVPFQVE